MKLVLTLVLAVTLLGGCVVVPLGYYGHRGDGYRLPSGVRLLTANVITPYRPTIASSSPSPPIEPRRTAPIRLGTKANTILSRMVLSLYYRRPVHLPNDLLDCLQQQRRRARRAHESARPTH